MALVATQLGATVVQPIEQRHLVACVATVVQQDFPVGRTIHISSTGDDDDYANSVLEAIHRLEVWPLQVTEPSRQTVLPPNLQKISSYIIFTRSINDFIDQAEVLYWRDSWDSRGRFLVAVTAKVPNSEELAFSIVQELWRIGRGYNVVVVVEQDTLLNLYTWLSYSSHDHCGDVRDVVLINQWVMQEEGKFVRGGSLFTYRTPSNFHGCTINLCTALKGEIEDEYFNQYFLTYNITKKYAEYPDNLPLYGIVVHCLGKMLNKETDMLFGSMALVVGADTISKSEPSVPYFVLKFSWFVPCSKPLSRLQKISHIFSFSLWVFLVVVLFLVTVAFWSVAKHSNDIRSYNDMSSALYNIWALTVGVSVRDRPRNLRLKIMFIVFVWYCSAISTVFQTFLTTFLIDPGYENQLKSLEGILDSGIEFGYPEDYNILFGISSDLRHKEVLATGEIYPTEQACIDKIRETGNFATFLVEWVVQNYTRAVNDHSTICPLNDEDYTFLFISAYVRTGSVFLHSLNKFITSSIESGMAGKAVGESVYVTRSTRSTTDVSDGYLVLAFSHLRIAFYILFLGHSLGFLLFVWEVLYQFRIRRSCFCTGIE